MKEPHEIIIRPHITERSMKATYGDEHIRDEAKLVRKYTFVVAMNANKIEIKNAIEAIYNSGKKKGETITVESVRTMTMHGKKRSMRARAGAAPTSGNRPDRKKAIITLACGQMLEDYGV
jgi:large subunit ribosomal protein L23